MLTVFLPHNDKTGGESLFSRVQSIAARNERTLMDEAYAFRDAMKTGSAGGREICEKLVDFGTAECAACVDKLQQVVDGHFATSDASQLEQLDVRLCMPLLHLTAERVRASFAEKLRGLFPEAVDDANLLGFGKPFAVSIGPLKGEPRIRVKMSEYREENERAALLGKQASSRAMKHNKWIHSTRVSWRACALSKLDTLCQRPGWGYDPRDDRVHRRRRCLRGVETLLVGRGISDHAGPRTPQELVRNQRRASENAL